ncbi:MAG: CBS domain-containing protein [Candidatus Nealsonbacteria bacterium]|nr:CBS domain-containing protein [Candidatus Nealsonbacteria bacterium]
MIYNIVRPDTVIKVAMEKISEKKQTMFPIVHAKTGVYCGYVTRDDINKYCVKFYGVSEESITMIDVLFWVLGKLGQPRNISVFEDTSQTLCIKIMLVSGLQFIPVIDYDGTYLGTIDAEGLRELTEFIIKKLE